eukprot:m.267428 g.267428  ORF g.267428 m.267428 type:complete len:948 (+) comp15639_c0_seq1:280-3123(+)
MASGYRPRSARRERPYSTAYYGDEPGSSALSRPRAFTPGDYRRRDQDEREYARQGGTSYHDRAYDPRDRYEPSSRTARAQPPSQHRPISEDTATDRYVRLLERDVAALKEDLRLAREKADDPEVMRELRETRDQLRQATSHTAELEHKLTIVTERAEAAERLHDDLDHLREEARNQQLELAHLERDKSRAEETVAAIQAREDTLTEDVTRLRQSLQEADRRKDELQRELQDLQRSAAREKDSLALQHDRALSTAQHEIKALEQRLKTKDQELKAKTQTIESLQDKLRKEVDHSKQLSSQHDKTLHDVRQAKQAVEESLRDALQKVDAAQSEIALKADAVSSLEDQLSQQQARIEEQTGIIAALRDEVLGASADGASHTATIESLTSDLERTQSELQTSEDLRRASEEREAKSKVLYNEIAQLVGASEGQRLSGLVSTKVRELVGERDGLQAEVKLLKQDHQLTSQERQTSVVRAEHLERTIARAQEEKQKAESETVSLREELLARTRELKDSMLSQEAMVRDARALEDRIQRYEDIIAQKDRDLEDAERRAQHAVDDATAELEREREQQQRIKTLHQREVDRLKTESQFFSTQTKSDSVYADVCQRIALMLHVDPDVSASMHTQKLLGAVSELKSKVTKAEAEQQQKQQLLDTLSRPPTSFETASVSQLERQLSEAKVEHESFRREIARCLQLSHVYSDDDVLDGVRSFAHNAREHQEEPRKKPTPPSGRRNDGRTPSSRTHRGRPEPSRKERDTLKGTAEKAEHKAAQLKQKLETAMKTIESQDLWIEVLNQKLESSKSDMTPDTQAEITRLQEQVEYFKAQAATLETSLSRPGTMSASAGVASMDDVLAFKTTIENLESRLQNYIEFRTKIINALGMNVISATDREILDAIARIARSTSKGYKRDTDSEQDYRGYSASYSSSRLQHTQRLRGASRAQTAGYGAYP